MAVAVAVELSTVVAGFETVAVGADEESTDDGAAEEVGWTVLELGLAVLEELGLAVLEELVLAVVVVFAVVLAVKQESPIKPRRHQRLSTS